MPKQTLAFEIDDSLTVDQTVATFGEALKQVDSQLAEVLAPALSDLSQEIAISQDQLLDVLYAATAPAAADAQSGDGSNDQ
jgi:hypothetical protein